jgi:hypothetical protein
MENKMKKLLIALILVAGAFEASALNVVVSNVVVAHQNEDQRKAYTGRLGELVMNTNSWGDGLTVFDGVNPGGTPLQEKSSDLFFYLPHDENHNAAGNLSSGSNLVALVASLTNIANQITDSFIDTPEIVLGKGVFQLDQDLVVTKNLIIRGTYESSHSLIKGVAGTGSIYDSFKRCPSEIRTLNDSKIIVNGPDSLRLNNILTDCEIQYSSGEGDLYLVNSSISGNIYSNANKYIFISESRINGKINEGLSTPGSLFYAYNTYFGSSCSGSMIKAGHPDNTLNNVYMYSGAMPLPAAAFAPVNGFYGTGEGSFQGDCLMFGPAKIENCTFTSVDTNWFNGTITNPQHFHFINCHGLPEYIADKGVTLLNCTDENGNVIPDQPATSLTEEIIIYGTGSDGSGIVTNTFSFTNGVLKAFLSEQ